MKAQTPAAHTRLRITRRGRVVLTSLIATPLVGLIMMAVLSGGGAFASNISTASRPLEYISVAQGDSLWEIAEAIAPDDDPRLVIDQIMQLNDLDNESVWVGQRLALPLHG